MSFMSSSYDFNNNETDGPVRLSLNKPKSCAWELTTSKSSPNLSFPQIQLYDSKTNQLLVEANEANCKFQGNEKLERHFINDIEIPLSPKVSHSRSHSLNAASRHGGSKRSLLEEAIVGNFVKQLTDQGIEYAVRSRSGSCSSREPPKLQVPITRILKKSKSDVEVPRRKKDVRSSSSVRFSTSFLQRVSERKDESSSDSEMEMDKDKRYFYRSSKAGTLLLCEQESFKKKRRRRTLNLDSLLETAEENQGPHEGVPVVQAPPAKSSEDDDDGQLINVATNRRRRGGQRQNRNSFKGEY